MIAYRLLVDFHVSEAAISGCRLRQRAKRINDFAARAVVQSQRQQHSCIFRRCATCLFHFALYRFRQLALAPNVLQTNIIFVERFNLRFQIAA